MKTRIVGLLSAAVLLATLTALAENVTGTYDVRTTNEWGWSDVTARQTNSLSVHVLHPNVDPFLVEMSNLITIDESKTVHHESLIPGHHYFAHFLTSRALSAGRSVVILVGHTNLENCFCDDVGFYSDTSFHWLIKSVEVRVRP